LSAQAVSLSTSLGLIVFKESMSTASTKLNVHTGMIRTREIITKDYIAITKFGTSQHNDIVADKIVVDTEWGYSSVIDTMSFSPVLEVDVHTGYGKSFIMLNNQIPSLNFTLENKRGHNSVLYEDKHFKCHGFRNKTTPFLLNGKCSKLDSINRVSYQVKSDKSKANIVMNTVYGDSQLIVD